MNLRPKFVFVFTVKECLREAILLTLSQLLFIVSLCYHHYHLLRDMTEVTLGATGIWLEIRTGASGIGTIA